MPRDPNSTRGGYSGGAFWILIASTSACEIENGRIRDDTIFCFRTLRAQACKLIGFTDSPAKPHKQDLPQHPLWPSCPTNS